MRTIRKVAGFSSPEIFKNIAQEVSVDYLSELSELADEEDKWITRVKDENQQWEIHPYGGFIEVVLKDFGGKTALGQQSPTLLRRE